jgi:hypothetical protein
MLGNIILLILFLTSTALGLSSIALENKEIHLCECSTGRRLESEELSMSHVRRRLDTLSDIYDKIVQMEANINSIIDSSTILTSIVTDVQSGVSFVETGLGDVRDNLISVGNRVESTAINITHTVEAKVTELRNNVVDEFDVIKESFLSLAGNTVLTLGISIGSFFGGIILLSIARCVFVAYCCKRYI